MRRVEALLTVEYLQDNIRLAVLFLARAFKFTRLRFGSRGGLIYVRQQARFLLEPWHAVPVGGRIYILQDILEFERTWFCGKYAYW